MNTDTIKIAVLDELAGHFEMLPITDAMQIAEDISSSIIKRVYPRFISTEEDRGPQQRAGSAIAADQLIQEMFDRRQNDDEDDNPDKAPDEQEKSTSLTPKQAEVLEMIIALHANGGDTHITGIAEAMDCPPGNINKVVQKLAQWGFISASSINIPSRGNVNAYTPKRNIDGSVFVS